MPGRRGCCGPPRRPPSACPRTARRASPCRSPRSRCTWRACAETSGALETAAALARDGRLEPGVVDPDLRALALVNLGIAELWTGEAASAARHLERGRGAAADAGRDWLVLVAVAHLALLTGMQHDFPARPGMPPTPSRSPSSTAGSGHGRGAAYLPRATAEILWDRGDDAGRSVELARDALHGTQERPLRACRRCSAPGCSPAPATSRRRWPCSRPDRGARRLAAARADPQPVRCARGDAAGRARRPRGRPARSATAPAAPRRSRARSCSRSCSSATATGKPPARPFRRGRRSVRRRGRRPPWQAWLVEALALDAAADHDGAAVALERALERAEPERPALGAARFGRSPAPLLGRSCGAAPPTGRWSASCWRRSTAPTGATGRTRRS